MITESEQERLLHEIRLASYEVVSLGDLGSEILPLLDRLFNTSTSLLYRFHRQHKIEDIAGSLCASHQEYTEEYYAGDPMQNALRRLNPWLLHATSVPEYREFLSHPVHTECSTHYGMDNFLHLKLSDLDIGAEGMVGLLLARSSRQPDFSEREIMNLSSLLPSLEALTRRNARVGEGMEERPFLEDILNRGPYPTLAFDLQGALLWISERAKEFFQFNRPGKSRLPDVLVGAVCRLGALVKKKGSAEISVPTVRLHGKEGTVDRAHLRLCRNSRGILFVLAELEGLSGSQNLSEVSERYRLTPAETQVLGWVAEGLSDKEIGRRLFVSVHTVHSHLRRLFSKLGVKSRVKAARMALGHPIFVDDEDVSQEDD
ncbi:MAG: helix-turn-helix transcriptional regulator [bacterium]